MEELEPRYQLPFWSLPGPLCHDVPKEPETRKFHTFIALGTAHWNFGGFHSWYTVDQFGDSGRLLRGLIASGQRIDVRIVEKCVVAIPPGEGLWREGRQITTICSLGFPLLPSLSLRHTLVRMRRWW